MRLATALDGLGPGNAQNQSTTPICGGVCPSAIVALQSLPCLVSLAPSAVLAPAFALPNTLAAMGQWMGVMDQGLNQGGGGS